jgi:Na+/serine symporter
MASERCFLLWMTAALDACAASAVAAADPPAVDFACEIYPIWQQACFDCHGRDK